MENGPILYVGGDPDDSFLVEQALGEIGCTSDVINFDNGYQLIVLNVASPGLNSYHINF